MELWPLMTIVGPVLLLAALAWAIWRNKQSKIPDSVTEAGARQVRAEEEEARRTGTDGDE